MWLHKKHLIWVREEEKGLYYFNIERWQFRRFREEWKKDDFYEWRDIVTRRELMKRFIWIE